MKAKSCLAIFYPHPSSRFLPPRKPPNMSTYPSEKPTAVSEIEAQHDQSKGDPVYDVEQKRDYDRTGAIDAERVEHDMGVIQAVKAYPAASFWAFVMSCTIVSSCS